MLYSKSISLIIPCKNEQESLPSLFKNVPSFVDQIIVIDNNSSDHTSAIAKKLGAEVLSEKREIDGIGYGFAHLTGLQAATGEYLIAMDGDNGYPLGCLNDVIRKMERENLDFVSCCRFPLENQRNMSFVRLLGGKVLTLFFNLLFGQNISDILTGMWVLKKGTLTHLDLTEGDWNFSINIKASAILSDDIKFAEHHINYRDRPKGTSKQSLLKTGLKHLNYIFRLKNSLKSKKGSIETSPLLANIK